MISLRPLFVKFWFSRLVKNCGANYRESIRTVKSTTYYMLEKRGWHRRKKTVKKRLRWRCNPRIGRYLACLLHLHKLSPGGFIVAAVLLEAELREGWFHAAILAEALHHLVRDLLWLAVIGRVKEPFYFNSTLTQ